MDIRIFKPFWFLTDLLHSFFYDFIIMPVLKNNSLESKSFLSFFYSMVKLWQNYGLNCGKLWQKEKNKKLNKINVINLVNHIMKIFFQ